MLFSAILLLSLPRDSHFYRHRSSLSLFLCLFSLSSRFRLSGYTLVGFHHLFSFLLSVGKLHVRLFLLKGTHALFQFMNQNALYNYIFFSFVFLSLHQYFNNLINLKFYVLLFCLTRGFDIYSKVVYYCFRIDINEAPNMT